MTFLDRFRKPKAPPAPEEPPRPCAICGALTPADNLSTYAGRELCPTDSGRNLPISDDDRHFLLSLAVRDRPHTSPAAIAAGDVVAIGTDEHGQAVTLDRATRNKHLYLIGKSRTGKTTLMLNLMRGDLEHGDGLTFIDPAGDAAHQLLGYVPTERAAHVTFFDPTRDDCPALNLLALPYDRDKLAGEIVSCFRLFFDSWGPRMDMLLRNGLVALLDDRAHEPHSIADLDTLFTKPAYRNALAERATDARVRSFLTDDLPRFEKSALDPVRNKLDAFLSTRTLARLFSATTNALDFDQLLNHRRVLICSLSKGKIGEQPAKFLGGLIVAALTMAALARADQPPASRLDHFLYVDEFQNFAVDSFATIFAEAAKYRLNLCVAHQTRAQLTPEIHGAIGNASTFIVFRISADDATTLARELTAERAALTPLQRACQQELEPVARALLRNPRDPKAFSVAPNLYEATRAVIVHRETLPHLRALIDKADQSPLNLLRLAAHVFRDPKPPADAKRETWPRAGDITNLKNLHAFARIERPENTTAIVVPFPPDPSNAARAAVFAAQLARARPQTENRPREKPQVARTATDPGATPHQEPTKSPKPPGDDFDEFLT